MSQELIRSDSVLGAKQVIAGSRDKDFVIQTKGKVKIQQGNSFIDLIKDGKINSPTIIHIVDTINDIGTKTGFYYVRNEDGMYALVEKSLIPLGGGAGGSSSSEGVKRLDELEDVMLVNLRDGDLLVQQGGYWVNTLFNVNDLEDMITGNLDEIRDALKNQSDYTQRTWQDVMETFNMMFDPEGNYFTEKITPLAVHTAQLIVGTNSQQFSLENIKFSPNHLGDENRFAAFVIDISKPGLLIHNTIGLQNNDDTVGATWEVLHNISGSFTAPDFDQTGLDPGKPYYLYAKCSKTSNQGEFQLSDEQKLLESEDGYYMFWVGVLNTPRASLSDGGTEISGGVSDATVKASKVRSFQTMYGFTEIAGNTITTGVIKDQTGSCYWDMINGNFRMGNGNTYVRFDSDTGKLFIKGYLEQEDPDSPSVMITWRGQFQNSSSIKYSKGDVVMYNGNTYICIKDCYGNILPTNTTYWELYTAKGEGFKIIYRKAYSTPSQPSASTGIPSGWSEDAQSPSSGGYNVYYSTGVRNSGEELYYWSYPALYSRYAEDGADGNDGNDGEDGPQGPTVTFEGTYDPSTIYYGTYYRASVVKSGSTFYVANYTWTRDRTDNSVPLAQRKPGLFTNKPLSNTNYWTQMNSFESVATDILVVSEWAHIAGWVFNNKVMWSETNDVLLNGITNNSDPTWHVIAVGKDCVTPPTSIDVGGKVNANNAVFRVMGDGTLYATNAHIKGDITATSGTFTNCQITNSCKIGGFTVENGQLYWKAHDYFGGDSRSLKLGVSEVDTEGVVNVTFSASTTGRFGIRATGAAMGGACIYTSRKYSDFIYPPSSTTWAGYFDGAVYGNQFSSTVNFNNPVGTRYNGRSEGVRMDNSDTWLIFAGGIYIGYKNARQVQANMVPEGLTPF